MDLDKAIKSRKSAKKFKNKKPDWKDIIECVDSMRYAPMAGGNFSLKFIIVDDKEKIHKIAKAAQQNFISEADYVLVVVSLGSRTTTSYGKRGEIYLRQQAGAAIQKNPGERFGNMLGGTFCRKPDKARIENSRRC